MEEVQYLERPQSPFSFAKRVYDVKCFGGNETSAEKHTLREIKNLPNGFYVVKTTNDKGIISTSKLIIQH